MTRQTFCLPWAISPRPGVCSQPQEWDPGGTLSGDLKPARHPQPTSALFPPGHLAPRCPSTPCSSASSHLHLFLSLGNVSCSPSGP